MSYTIIGSLRSPFVRMNRLFMIQNNLEHKFHVINFLEDKTDAQFLESVSPINKVPVLLDGAVKIFDSRVIFNHLTHKHGLRPLIIDEENILTAIQSAMDVSVNLFLLERGGMKDMDQHPYIDRQKKRIHTSLEFVVPWAKKLEAHNSNDWNYVSMALFSYLDWAEFRNLLDLKGYPDFIEFMKLFKNSKGIKETDFRL